MRKESSGKTWRARAIDAAAVFCLASAAVCTFWTAHEKGESRAHGEVIAMLGAQQTSIPGLSNDQLKQLAAAQTERVATITAQMQTAENNTFTGIGGTLVSLVGCAALGFWGWSVRGSIFYVRRPENEDPQHGQNVYITAPPTADEPTVEFEKIPPPYQPSTPIGAMPGHSGETNKLPWEVYAEIAADPHASTQEMVMGPDGTFADWPSSAQLTAPLPQFPNTGIPHQL